MNRAICFASLCASAPLRELAFLLAAACVCAASASAEDRARVILISVDGLRPDAISAEFTPTIDALRRRGVSAQRALNDLPSSTLPNHATMLTGLVQDVHGLVADFAIPGKIEFRTLFDFVADAGLRCAFFASKSKLEYLAPPDALETIRINADQTALVDDLLPQLAPGGPDLIFLHLREPDSTGHRSGWMSPAYLAACGESDRQIARVVEAADADPTRQTYLLITADHGGTGLSHFANTAEDREIPWIVVGPGIPAASILDQTISTADTTPTVLMLLGVDTPPGLSGVARSGILQRPPIATSEDTALLLPPVGVPCVVFLAPLLVAFVAVGRRRAAGLASGRPS
ncbi:MAG: alkaline phosphatase family protein [Phycisphaerae bacterium]